MICSTSPLGRERSSRCHIRAWARDQLGTVGSGQPLCRLFETRPVSFDRRPLSARAALGHKTRDRLHQGAGARGTLIEWRRPCCTRTARYGRKTVTIAGSDDSPAFIYAYAGRASGWWRRWPIVGGRGARPRAQHHNYACAEEHIERNRGESEMGVGCERARRRRDSADRRGMSAAHGRRRRRSVRDTRRRPRRRAFLPRPGTAPAA